MTTCIVGWSHTPFGKHESEDVESLIMKVATAAVADAGLEVEDIDELVLGTYNEGFSPQGFPSSLILQADEAFRFKPRLGSRTLVRPAPPRCTRGSSRSRPRKPASCSLSASRR